MKFNTIQLKYDFEIVEIGGETVAVAVDDGANSFHGIIKLKNDSARFIFESIKQKISFDELTDKCLAEYSDSSKEEIVPAVEAFLESLFNEGVLNI